MDKLTTAEQVTMNGQPAVQYLHPDGTKTIKVGGTKAFRNNNPGNVGYTEYTRQLGAIGVDDAGRAIFPDWETGDRAMATLLRHGKYRKMSIRETIYEYAGPEGGNPTEEHIRYVVARSGLPEGKRINEMADDEFDRFQASMREFEDGTPGYDLVLLDPAQPWKWHRIEYLKFKKDGSPKDPANYGPDVPLRHDQPIDVTPGKNEGSLPKPGSSHDRQSRNDSGGSSASAARSNSGETLERRGDNVYRIEEDGRTRGSFVSK